MLTIDKAETYGWEAAIRGMRNAMNSWDRMDTVICDRYQTQEYCDAWKYGESSCQYYNSCERGVWINDFQNLHLGKNDLDLMKRLRKAGADHRKYMRMIVVYCDITAPLYWWKQFNTYKVGTVLNSCSTMHKIQAKKFTLDDFSHEHLLGEADDCEIGVWWGTDADNRIEPKDLLELNIDGLNKYRNAYLETKDEKYWWQMIQLLGDSYNQKGTVMFNYEVLANIYKSRKNHKLDEWNAFCDWIKTLPYSELITG